MLQNIWLDFKSALRSLKRSPGFAAAAIATVALGTGANTTIFSFVDAVLLRTLPVRVPEELSFVGHRDVGVAMSSNFPWYERVR